MFLPWRCVLTTWPNSDAVRLACLEFPIGTSLAQWFMLHLKIYRDVPLDVMAGNSN